MNKLEMAHDYLKVLLTQNTSRTVGEAVETAYALAEADKRKLIPKLPALQKTFIDGVEQPRYAPSCDEWQPDWDLAPSDATTWKTVDNVAIWLSSNGQPLCTAPTFGITGRLVVERPQ